MQLSAQRLRSATSVSHRSASPYLRWHSSHVTPQCHTQLHHRRPKCTSVPAVQEKVQQTCPWGHGVSTIQGPRDDMEDDTCVIWDQESSSLFLAMFDGHGGSAAAQYLAKNLHSMILPKLRSQLAKESTFSRQLSKQAGLSQPAELSELFVQAFHEADKEVMSALDAMGGRVLAETGATATVVLLQGGRIITANIGDSAAVLSRRGTPVILSIQHRVYGVGAEVQAEIRRVNSTGGWVDDGRVCGVLAVSRAFGDWEFKGEGLKQLMIDGIEKGYWDEKLAAAAKFSSDPVVPTPDVTEIAIREEDELLIVATDGLWDYLPAGEACRWARKQFMAGMSPQEVADALTELAERRNTADNVGVVVVDLKGAAGWSSMPAKSSKTGGLFGGLFGKKG